MTNAQGNPGWSAVLVAAVLMTMAAAIPAKAQSYAVPHSFSGPPDGSVPYAGLVLDASGNLYGTTTKGGDTTCVFYGCGTVFRISKAGEETVLHSFTGSPDGEGPYEGKLILDTAGNLYGATDNGGDLACSASNGNGCGTIFKLDAAGTETVLYSFAGGTDAAYPLAGLVRDSAGNLCGTTYEGGGTSCMPPYGCGTVFKVDASGGEIVLHSFTGGRGGSQPRAGLLRDGLGNLYGTTYLGGVQDLGTFFKLKATGNESGGYSFIGGTSGDYPRGNLLEHSGDFYGITSEGGNPACPDGCGTVFKIDSTGAETVLYSFTGGTDGAAPVAGLVRDTAGNLYGTTYYGGSVACNNGQGCGTVFKLDTTGGETVLHSFTGGTDGAYPLAGLVLDGVGNLYGTTSLGGASGYGVVFALRP
ncbi:MAG TPA: choice-of-anchor tandem repeat GloVer-containing protein [Terriglobia bacterium]|nr:choice-of-anchor tandem repeat GloVer-containing protein [Terriglobia bacterium]